MRLIDADALKEEIGSWGMNDYEPLDFIEAIDDAPTVAPYQGEECVYIKMSEEESKQFKQMLQEHTPLYSITSDTFVEVVSVDRPQGEWIPVSERLPEGKIDPMTKDFELVLCSTVWNVVRLYTFGKPIGHDKAHFWNGGGVMDDYVIAWMPLPEAYKEADHE